MTERSDKGGVARLWASMTKRVNLRTTVEVLTGLVGVVAFALVFPPWLTVAVAAIAVGAGIIRAAERRIRATLIVLPAITVVALATYLLAHQAPGQQPASAEHEPHKWVTVGYGMQAALEVKDLTFRNRWGTTIEADGWDRLQFRLLVRNTNASSSPPVVARMYVNQSGEGRGRPHLIGLSFGLSRGGTFIAGPTVNLIAQSGGLYQFRAEPFHFGEASGSTLSGEPTYLGPKVEVVSFPPRRPPAEGETGLEYAIPSIRAHSTVAIGFTGSYDIPGDSGLSHSDVVKIKNPRGPSTDYNTTASAAPGDTLTVWGTLSNDGFRGIDVHVRIRFHAEEKETVNRVTLYAREDRGRFRVLGSATVNSGRGTPIKLTVQPGSTELIAPRTKCTKEQKKPLPDGIAESGVDIGTVGGWVPRDPCNGTEFHRYVLFNVDVR